MIHCHRRAIILKALKQSHSRGENMQEVASRIADYLEALEDSTQVVDTTSRPPLSDPSGKVVVMPSPEIVEPEQPEEILPPPKVMAGGKEVHYRTIEEIRRTLEAYAPPNLMVQPPGFEKPMGINRIIKNPPSGLNFVKLMYVPDGHSEGPSVIFATTEPEMNLQKGLADIKTQASMMYSAERRVIQVKSPPVTSESDFMRAGVGSDADQVASFDPKVSQAFRTDRTTWDNYAKE